MTKPIVEACGREKEGGEKESEERKPLERKARSGVLGEGRRKRGKGGGPTSCQPQGETAPFTGVEARGVSCHGR